MEPFLLLLRDVGLSPGAEVTINVTIANPIKDTSLLILTREQMNWIYAGVRSGSLVTNFVHGYVRSYWRYPFVKSFEVHHRIQAPREDRYYVVLLNAQRMLLSAEGHIDYVNLGGQHLPMQLNHLPIVYWASSAAYAALLIVVAVLLVVWWARHSTPLHALLMVVLWLKSIELALKWSYYTDLSEVGRSSVWTYKLCQMTLRAQSTCDLLLLLLMALGWRMLRPRLSVTETRFIAVAGGFSLSMALLQATSFLSEQELIIAIIFQILQLVFYLMIIFAISVNLQLIAATIADHPMSTIAAMLYRKQQTYMYFRRLFMVICLRPSIVLWLQGATGVVEWFAEALSQGSGWLVYATLVIIMFPSKHNLVELLTPQATGFPEDSPVSDTFSISDDSTVSPREAIIPVERSSSTSVRPHSLSRDYTAGSNADEQVDTWEEEPEFNYSPLAADSD